MKEGPEIDPEILQLLEEVAASPRSCLRTAPKRALAPWFFSDERVSARDISSSRFEQHLVEAHREALAQLLYEAARIAYWKAPVLSHPWRRADGNLVDLEAEEKAWRLGAPRFSVEDTSLVDLVRLCMDGIQPRHGYALARASLLLVPRDETRLVIANHMKADAPRAALFAFERVASQSTGMMASVAWSSVAGRLSCLGQYEAARVAYLRASEDWPQSHIFLLNLSFLTGDARAAHEHARVVASLWSPDSVSLEEGVNVIRTWVRALPVREATEVKRFLNSIRHGLPEVAMRIGEGYA